MSRIPVKVGDGLCRGHGLMAGKSRRPAAQSRDGGLHRDRINLAIGRADMAGDQTGQRTVGQIIDRNPEIA